MFWSQWQQLDFLLIVFVPAELFYLLQWNIQYLSRSHFSSWVTQIYPQIYHFLASKLYGSLLLRDNLREAHSLKHKEMKQKYEIHTETNTNMEMKQKCGPLFELILSQMWSNGVEIKDRARQQVERSSKLRHTGVIPQTLLWLNISALS